MKIAVMGTGGVGGVFGARLAASGTDVTFIARGKHLEAIKENGLQVLSERKGNALIKPAKATNDPASVGEVDFVFLTTKLWDTESAAQAIKPMIGNNTAVISFQNGVVKDDILKGKLGAEHVLGGVSYVSATIASPGVITQQGDAQRLVFGEYDRQKTKRVDELQTACRKADIEADVPEDIEIAIWEKFVFLVAMSAVLSATRQTIGPVRSNPKTRQILLDVMNEVVAVARARGVKLDDGIIDRRMQYCDALAPDVLASMFHDLQTGNRLELPWLSGAVVDMGLQYGIDTPVNRTLVGILSPYVDGRN